MAHVTKNSSISIQSITPHLVCDNRTRAQRQNWTLSPADDEFISTVADGHHPRLIEGAIVVRLAPFSWLRRILTGNLR
jgi:hypothetical protein